FQGQDNLDPTTGHQTPRVYKIEERGYDGVVHENNQVADKMAQVLSVANEWGNKIPIGIFYQNEFIPTYEERISQRISDYPLNPPAGQSISNDDDLPLADISELLAPLRLDT